MAKERIAIVTDGDAWYVRRIRLVEHDIERDEKVYRCDAAIGPRLDTIDQATSLAKEYLSTANAAR